MGFSDIFDADFGRGLITEFSKTVTEDIKEGQKRGRAFVDEMRKGHVARARAAEEKRLDKFNEVSDSLDQLAGLSNINGNYDIAAQYFAALGKSPEQVTEFVTKTVPVAQAYAKANDVEWDWNSAVKLADADPNASPKTRLEAINSFIRGREGVYSGTIQDVTIPTSGWLSLLGEKDTDMRNKVEQSLAAEGFKPGDDVPLAPIVPAQFDMGILRPDLVVNARKAELDNDKTAGDIDYTAAQIAKISSETQVLDEELKLIKPKAEAQIRNWNASAASANATTEQTRASLESFKMFDAREQRLALRLKANQITREASGSTAEAGYSFALMREKEINARIANIERNSLQFDPDTNDPNPAYARAKDELKEILMFQTQISGMLASDQQSEIFSKMSIPRAFNMYYESALSLLTNAKFTPGIDGSLASIESGDKLAGIRAFQSAKKSFSDAFNKVPNVQSLITPIVNSFQAQINQGGQQYLETVISKYNTDMSRTSRWGSTEPKSDIQIQDYYDIDGKEVNTRSIRAFDTGKTNKVLFRINPPITKGTVTQRAAQQKAQNETLKALGYLDAQGKSTLVDDPNTPLDESIAYMIYAGNGNWVAQ